MIKQQERDKKIAKDTEIIREEREEIDTNTQEISRITNKEVDEKSQIVDEIEERKTKSHRRKINKADEQIIKELLKQEKRIGERSARRKTSYKEVKSDVDEEKAEKEGKEKTEKTKIVKQRQRIAKELRKRQLSAAESSILNDPVPGSSKIARGMRPMSPGRQEIEMEEPRRGNEEPEKDRNRKETKKVRWRLKKERIWRRTEEARTKGQECWKIMKTVRMKQIAIRTKRM